MNVQNTKESDSTATKVAKFLKIVESHKKGNLVERTETYYTPAEALDEVETTLNYTYADPNDLYSNNEISDTSITVSLTNDTMSGADLATLYSYALHFASSHFYSIADTSKKPKLYDVVLTSSNPTTAVYKVISIVERGNIDGSFSTKSFTGGYSYEAMMASAHHCSPNTSRLAPTYLTSFINYNLKPLGGGIFYFTDLRNFNFFSHEYYPMWQFWCKGATPPSCCNSCSLCSSYSNNDINDIYCLDETEMNAQLSHISTNVIPTLVTSGRHFANIYIDPREYCSLTNSEDDEWISTLTDGIRNIRTVDAPELLPLP